MWEMILSQNCVAWSAAGQVGEVLSAEKEILFEDAEWLLARATPFAPLSLHPRPPPCLRAFLPTILFPISPPLHLQVASGPCNVRVCRVGGAPCWANGLARADEK